MTLDTANLRMINTITKILSKFPPIQNKENWAYYGRGNNVKFYGLKSTDFNKFKDIENGARTFNYWKDKLVEFRLLKRIYQDKKNGPYTITPFGVAYLVQNSNTDRLDILNCINVVMYYFKGDKTGLNFSKLNEESLSFFRNSCRLIKFENSIHLQSRKAPEVLFDVRVMSSIIPNDRKRDKRDFEDCAYFIIGNMCWIMLDVFLLSRFIYDIEKENNKILNINREINVDEYNVYTNNFNKIPKEIKSFGISFGERVVAQTLKDHLDTTNDFIKISSIGYLPSIVP